MKSELCNIIKYRNSRLHRRCEFCVYYKHRSIDAGCQIHELHECKCKDKYIKYPNLIRFLCPYFILNKDKCRKDAPLATLVITDDGFDTQKIQDCTDKMNKYIEEANKKL